MPVRRWQRVQWQYVAETSGAVSSKRTAPQPHPPVMRLTAHRSSRLQRAAARVRSRSGSIPQRRATSSRRSSTTQRSGLLARPRAPDSPPLSVMQPVLSPSCPDRLDVGVGQPQLAGQRGELGALVLDRPRPGSDLLDQRRHDARHRLVGEVPLARELDRGQAGALRRSAASHPSRSRPASIQPAGRKPRWSCGAAPGRAARRRRTARRSRRRA